MSATASDIVWTDGYIQMILKLVIILKTNFKMLTNIGYQGRLACPPCERVYI